MPVQIEYKTKSFWSGQKSGQLPFNLTVNIMCDNLSRRYRRCDHYSSHSGLAERRHVNVPQEPIEDCVWDYPKSDDPQQCGMCMMNHGRSSQDTRSCLKTGCNLICGQGHSSTGRNWSAIARTNGTQGNFMSCRLALKGYLVKIHTEIAVKCQYFVCDAYFHSYDFTFLAVWHYILA